MVRRIVIEATRPGVAMIPEGAALQPRCGVSGGDYCLDCLTAYDACAGYAHCVFRLWLSSAAWEGKGQLD